APRRLLPAGQLAAFDQLAVALAGGVLLVRGLLEAFEDVLLRRRLILLDLGVLGLREELANGLAVLVLHLFAHALVAYVAFRFGIGRILVTGVVLVLPFRVEWRQGRGALQAPGNGHQGGGNKQTSSLHPQVSTALFFDKVGFCQRLFFASCDGWCFNAGS